jgi:Tfp pilus assembly protein PilX
MHKKTMWRREEGAVLVVAVFITLALVVLGSLASLMTDVELDIARNDRFGKEAFFIADAGLPISERVIRDTALNEGVNPSDYPGISIDGNFLNEVRNYYEGNTSLNDKPVDTPTNNPDIQTTVAGRNVGVDIDWRVKKVGPGGSLLFAMGYEGIGADRSHGGVKFYYDVESLGRAPGNVTSRVGAVYLYQ